MTKATTLQRIAPDQLADLLTRLDDGRTTDLALIGPNVELSASPDDWPEELQGYVVFQLTGNLSGLPRELLRLGRLRCLTTRWATPAPRRLPSTSVSSSRSV